MSKKTGSQKEGTSWGKRLLDSSGDQLTEHAISRNKDNRQKTRKYLDEISLDFCLILLSKALGPLLNGTKNVDSIFRFYARTNDSSKRLWNEDSFTRFLQTRPPENTAVIACIPTLWHAFCIAASFPFSPRSKDAEIDANDFRRAFAFLMTRGYELLGAKSDGSSLDENDFKASYADKVPRLARIIFRSLSTPGLQFAAEPGHLHESLQPQDIKDSIAFTQPILVDDLSIETPRATAEKWDAAANRVLLADHAQSKASSLSLTVTKADLQNIIQLFLLHLVQDG